MTNNTQEYQNLRRLIFPPQPLSPREQLRQIFTQAGRESGKRSLNAVRAQASREAREIIRKGTRQRVSDARNLHRTRKEARERFQEIKRQGIKHRGEVRRILAAGRRARG